jgi:hypothetical protein
MRRVPFRWALPIFHLAMDAALVAVFVAMLHPFLPISYDQNVTMMIDPRSPGLVKPFLLLTTGALPAGFVSLLALFTIGHAFDIPYGSKGWLWFGFYEFLAVSLWFLISRIPSAYGWCAASMLFRVLACSIVGSNIWWVVQDCRRLSGSSQRSMLRQQVSGGSPST